MARTALTFADYEALPSDGRHYQILDGELFVTATPNTSHQRVVGNLFAMLRAHVRAGRLGEVFVSPVTVILADTTVVEPDIVFVGSDRLPLINRRGIAGAPTLLVEVLSPSTSRVSVASAAAPFSATATVLPCCFALLPSTGDAR